MKKKKWLAVAILCCLFSTGCGSQLDKNVENVVSGSVTTGSADVQEQQALSVENDTFTFDALLGLIGQNEDTVNQTLGDSNGEETDGAIAYDTALFGEDVNIVVTYEKDTVTKLTLTFFGTDEDALMNAISEQLGSDSEVSGQEAAWNLNNESIVLAIQRRDCIVTIQAVG